MPPARLLLAAFATAATLLLFTTSLRLAPSAALLEPVAAAAAAAQRPLPTTAAIKPPEPVACDEGGGGGILSEPLATAPHFGLLAPESVARLLALPRGDCRSLALDRRFAAAATAAYSVRLCWIAKRRVAFAGCSASVAAAAAVGVVEVVPLSGACGNGSGISRDRDVAAWLASRVGPLELRLLVESDSDSGSTTTVGFSVFRTSHPAAVVGGCGYDIFVPLFDGEAAAIFSLRLSLKLEHDGGCHVDEVAARTPWHVNRYLVPKGLRIAASPAAIAEADDEVVTLRTVAADPRVALRRWRRRRRSASRGDDWEFAPPSSSSSSLAESQQRRPHCSGVGPIVVTGDSQARSIYWALRNALQVSNATDGDVGAKVRQHATPALRLAYEWDNYLERIPATLQLHFANTSHRSESGNESGGVLLAGMGAHAASWGQRTFRGYAADMAAVADTLLCADRARASAIARAMPALVVWYGAPAWPRPKYVANFRITNTRLGLFNRIAADALRRAHRRCQQSNGGRRYAAVALRFVDFFAVTVPVLRWSRDGSHFDKTPAMAELARDILRATQMLFGVAAVAAADDDDDAADGGFVAEALSDAALDRLVVVALVDTLRGVAAKATPPLPLAPCLRELQAVVVVAPRLWAFHKRSPASLRHPRLGLAGRALAQQQQQQPSGSPRDADAAALARWGAAADAHARAVARCPEARAARRRIAAAPAVVGLVRRYWRRLVVVKPTTAANRRRSVRTGEPTAAEGKEGGEAELDEEFGAAVRLLPMQYAYLHLRLARIVLATDNTDDTATATANGRADSLLLLEELLDGFAADAVVDARHRAPPPPGLALAQPSSSAAAAPSRRGSLSATMTVSEGDGDESLHSATASAFDSTLGGSFNASVSARPLPATMAADASRTWEPQPPPRGDHRAAALARRDPRSLPPLTFEQFGRSLLELADNWTASAHPAEYAAVLAAWYRAIFADDTRARADDAMAATLRHQRARAASPVAGPPTTASVPAPAPAAVARPTSRGAGRAAALAASTSVLVAAAAASGAALDPARSASALVGRSRSPTPLAASSSSRLSPPPLPPPPLLLLQAASPVAGAPRPDAPPLAPAAPPFAAPLRRSAAPPPPQSSSSSRGVGRAVRQRVLLLTAHDSAGAAVAEAQRRLRETEAAGGGWQLPQLRSM